MSSSLDDDTPGPFGGGIQGSGLGPDGAERATGSSLGGGVLQTGPGASPTGPIVWTPSATPTQFMSVADESEPLLHTATAAAAAATTSKKKRTTPEVRTPLVSNTRGANYSTFANSEDDVENGSISVRNGDTLLVPPARTDGTSPRHWSKRMFGARPDGAVQYWRNTRGGAIRAALVVCGCMMMSLLAGTSNAFNAFQAKVQRDLDTSEDQMALVSGFGMLGLYFVLPAGALLDQFGALATSVGSVVLMAGGFFIFSFAKGWGVLLLGLCVMSFGAGSVFMCALKVALMQSASGGGWSVSLTSAAMSLSAAFAIFVVGEYDVTTGCIADDCWRQDFRFLGFLTLCITLPGSLLLFFFNQREYPHLHSADCDTDSEGEDEEEAAANQSLSAFTRFKQALLVFKSPFFLTLFFAFFSSIGSSVLILTNSSQIWKGYNTNPNLDKWQDNILVAFSFTNAASNVVSGVGADWLERHKLVRSTTVLAVVQLLFAGVFVFLGFILMGDSSDGSPVVVIVMMSSVGMLFGATLVLFPVVIGNTYGQHDFGKYFAFLQFASSAATLCVPPIATAVNYQWEGYSPVLWGLAGCLVLSSFLLKIMPQPQR